jgi:signal peptidase I
MCKGDIIVIMDDDDYYPVTRVQHAVEKLEDSDYLISGCSDVYMYSFNNNPVRETNLHGCNFSRLDNVQLQIEIKNNSFILNNNIPYIKYPQYYNYRLQCFATNYNILIIQNGLASVKYNN